MISPVGMAWRMARRLCKWLLRTRAAATPRLLSGRRFVPNSVQPQCQMASVFKQNFAILIGPKFLIMEKVKHADDFQSRCLLVRLFRMAQWYNATNGTTQFTVQRNTRCNATNGTTRQHGTTQQTLQRNTSYNASNGTTQQTVEGNKRYNATNATTQQNGTTQQTVQRNTRHNATKRYNGTKRYNTKNGTTQPYNAKATNYEHRIREHHEYCYEGA